MNKITKNSDAMNEITGIIKSGIFFIYNLPNFTTCVVLTLLPFNRWYSACLQVFPFIDQRAETSVKNWVHVNTGMDLLQEWTVMDNGNTGMDLYLYI